ncbi:putative tail protein [Rhizobium phage RHph_X3_15]|nr:putative tail protein [Rhizobium phage RHph_X3_15]
MSCGAEAKALELINDLLVGKTVTLPTVDLTDPEYQVPIVDPVEVTPLTNEALTTRQVNGSGTFDALMQSISAHLKVEKDANRIAGAEYTKAYIASTANALSTAVQYLLGKDQAYWQSVLAQAQAQTAQVQLVQARVALQTAKAEMAMMQYNALNAQAQYALTTMKLATEDQTYCQLIAQTELTEKQILLVQEQTEVQRSQTLDTRTDGVTPVAGTVKRQRDLYEQQKISYIRDSEVKAGKLFVDAWITQKTIDEGLVAPSGFTNASVDDVLTKIKTENGFV